MNLPEKTDDDQFLGLVVRYLDSSLTPQQADQLRHALDDSAQHRLEFVDVCLQAKLYSEMLGNRRREESRSRGDAVMSLDGGRPSADSTPNSPLLGFLNNSSQTPFRGEFLVGLLVVAAVLGAAWGVIRWQEHLAGPPQPGPAVAADMAPAQRSDSASIHRHDDLQRRMPLEPHRPAHRSGRQAVGRRPGSPRRPGRNHLRFRARVVLEGPAEFRLESSMRGYLSYGRVVATVPPAAHGFTIAADAVTVVDLGTEFGVDVDLTGIAAVHVFEGKVEVSRKAAQAPAGPEIMSTEASARFDATQGFINSPRTISDRFVRRVDQTRKVPRASDARRRGRPDGGRQPEHAIRRHGLCR